MTTATCAKGPCPCIDCRKEHMRFCWEFAARWQSGWATFAARLQADPQYVGTITGEKPS